jgi:EmrB/QacA subfamily drug resistance transporter
MTQTKHAAQEHRGHPGLALAVICIAQLMVVLDATVMNVALPSIQSDLGFTDTGLTWVITSYSLTFGGMLLFGGRIGDVFGRRRMFMAGVGLFALASLAGGLATNELALVVARAAQGIGGAIAAPTALALLATTFTQPDERARAFGVFAAMAASGGALGLLLGGVLTDLASWRWSLFINVPIGLAVILLAPRVLGESTGSGKRLDLPGAITITAGMIALVYGLTNAATHAWGDTATIVSLVAAGVLVLASVVIELRTAEPLLPARLLTDRNRTGAYLIMLTLAAAMFATFFFSSQYLQDVHGWSPLRTGLGFLPMPATIMFMSLVVVRRSIGRVGARPFLTAGPIFVAASMLLLSGLDAHSSYPQFLAGLLVLALGMGCVFVPVTMTAVQGVAHHETGVASALLNTGQQLGGAVGLAVLGTVAAHAGKDRAAELAEHAGTAGAKGGGVPAFIANDVFVHAQSAAFTGGVVMAGLALVVSLLLIRSPQRTAAGVADTEADAEAPVLIEA